RRRGLVHACRARDSARRAGATVPARGDDLVEGVRDGARALRRRGYLAPDPGLPRAARLAPPPGPVRSPLASVAQSSDTFRVHLSGRAHLHSLARDARPVPAARTRIATATTPRPATVPGHPALAG